MVRWLRERGVPPERILSDPAGLRTLDTMQRAYKLLNVENAIVCSQGAFLPRAVFLARAAGIDAVGFLAPTVLPNSWRILRTEAMKTGLAMLDTYVTGRGPAHMDMHGALMKQMPPSEPDQPPADFSFFTSAISAGMAVSQVATRP